ncbi:putative ribonuclease H-like domain-containing protein, partial [Tanacetum coccineum]
MFNMHVKANELKQSDKSLEDFWIALQGVWGEIYRIDPNLMKCPEDIKTYAKIRSDQKLFQFFNGLYRKFEPIKREILWVDPLPTAKTTYATVRKEAAHMNILVATNNEPQGIATGINAEETEGVGFNVACRGTQKNSASVLSDTRIGGPMATKRVPKVPKPRKKRFLPPILAPSTKRTQDIKTGRIIGCGTEREGLYYVDEVTTSGTVMLAHGTSEREEQSSPNISATKDTIPNLIFEVSNSQLSDSLDEILENIHETVGVQEHEEPTPIEVPENYSLLARSNRGIPPKRYTTEKASRSSKYPIANIARGNISKEAKAFFASLYLKKTPSNVEQASKSKKWKNAMDVEMDALMRNGTWDKCILLQEKKPVRCHWIFTIKYKPDVAKIDTIRVLFSIAANQGFLQGELKEEVYMEAPPGFSQHFKHGEVFMRSQHGIFICQKRYILDLIAETGMIGCKPADTPMITNQKLFINTEAKLADRDRYQRMVGKLIYLSHTRLDIAYVVGVVSQFMHQPQVDHMHAVLRIVRYLKGTTGHGVLFKTNGILHGGNLVTWKSKKQKLISLSSVKAELRGIAKGLAEALWIRKLVSEIGFPPKESIRIMSDNKAAIQISKNHVQHDRTKHVEVDRHFIKEKLEARMIKLPFVKSKDQEWEWCVITQETLVALCEAFHIPEEVHPTLPIHNNTMHEIPAGKIRLYTRFFDFANFRLLLSSFLVDVLRYFCINISQLSVIRAAKSGWLTFSKRSDHARVCYTKPLDSLKNWNNRFFWVDKFACPARFPWHTAKNVVKDHAPVVGNFNPQDYNTLEKIFFLSSIPSNPTKVKVAEHERREGEPPLLETSVGYTVPLLPVALARAEGKLEESVDRLFGDSGTREQADQGGFVGGASNVHIDPVIEAVDTTIEDVAPLQPRRQRKRKVVAVDAGEASHPPKTLRKDHGAPSGASIGGKSTSVVQRLLTGDVQNPQVGAAALPTLPFVTSCVSATPEREGGDNTNFVTGANLRIKEKGEMDVKVADLAALVKGREQEAADLDTVVTSVKSRNDRLVDQDDRMKEVIDKLEKLDADVVEMVLHLEEKFYPLLLTTISGRRWLLTHGMKLAIAKCLNSVEYLSVLGAAIGKAIEK